MLSSALFRWSGLAGILSGLCLAISVLVRVLFAPNLLAGTLLTLSPVLGLWAVTAVYLWQREKSGRLGAIGFIVNFLGQALAVGVVFANMYVVEFLTLEVRQQVLAGPTGLAFLIIMLVFLAGVILFGIATIRAAVFPPIPAVLYIIGFVPLSFFSLLPPITYTIGGVVAGAAMVWFGYVLWSGQGESAL